MTTATQESPRRGAQNWGRCSRVTDTAGNSRRSSSLPLPSPPVHTAAPAATPLPHYPRSSCALTCLCGGPFAYGRWQAAPRR